MPEGPEVTILGQYLLTKLEGRIIEDFEILGGKYKRTGMKNSELLGNKHLYKIKGIDTKGKLMWITLESLKNHEELYISSHLGLTGFWGFDEGANDRIKIKIIDEEHKDKSYYLYYEDDRNFGNINIYINKKDLVSKIDELAIDSLKGNYNCIDFASLYKKFLSKSAKRKDQYISLVLMKQGDDEGIISGIGNYLMAEILFRAKISPFRKAGSLSSTDIIDLCESIQYTTKLSYYNNTTGYMTHFDNFIKLHKERIKSGLYPNFHDHIKFKGDEEFKFNVYRQKKDPEGNIVDVDKSIQKTRSTYWVPNIQK
jgi:formamidopyrimidine-DNA glycosylase